MRLLWKRKIERSAGGELTLEESRIPATAFFALQENIGKIFQKNGKREKEFSL
ncbi:hypothetical protein [uncultured Selenomonas sp.]|uniref:hypothetical protein n=1 Tax=uncultured Selenomonas sp. TaxID=159275 RepID=UPI00262384B4|nr:hypothetical protein [uncultured Selenomonas sp.]